MSGIMSTAGAGFGISGPGVQAGASGSESMEQGFASLMFAAAVGIVQPTSQDVNGLDSEEDQDITPS